MIPFYCFRCNKNTFTIDRFRCLNCHNVKNSMVPERKKFEPAEPESRRSSSGCYVSVSDASTQTSEDDFVDIETTRDASTQTDYDDDFPLLDLTLDASTQTTDSDSSSPAQIVGYHEYKDEPKPVNDVRKLNFDSCNSSLSDCSFQSDCQDSSNNVNTLEDGQEKRNSNLVLTDSESSCPAQIIRYREYIDEPKPINDVKKLNLDSCNSGLSDCSSQSDRQDSSDIINTLEDGQEIRKENLILTESESSCPAQVVRYREYTDEPKPINDVKKLNLDSCNRGLSDCSSQSDRQDSSDIINTIEDCQEIRKDDLILTDSESNCPAQIVGCNEYIEESKPIKDVGTLNFDSCNHGLLDCSSHSECQESSIILNTLEEGQEISNSDLVLTYSKSSCPAQIVGYHEYKDESKPINDVGNLNFDSCNHGLSDCSSHSYCQESSNIVNTLEDGQKMRNKDLVITRKRSNDFNVDHYEGNDSIKRPFQEKEQEKLSTNGIKIHEPVNQPTKCKKCGKLISIADILRLYVENNCDEKSYKCDLCNKE